MLNGLAYLSLLFSYPFCLTSKKNLKNAHKNSTPKYWGEFCLLPSLLSPFAAATNVCGINTVERLHNGYLGDRGKRPLYRGRCYGVVGVYCHLYFFRGCNNSTFKNAYFSMLIHDTINILNRNRDQRHAVQINFRHRHFRQ